MNVKRLCFLVIVLLTAVSAAQAEAPAPEASKALSVRTFTFKYKDAEKAASVIKPLMSGDGTISIQPGTKSIVVSDRAENLKAVAKAIADYDVAPQTFHLSVRLVSAAHVAPEAAKAADEIKDIAPKLNRMGYNALESAGHADFEGKEGDPGILDLPSGYRADFKLGEYDPASNSVKLSDFHLARLQSDQLTPVLKTTLNLTLGQTYMVGATRSAKSERALWIILVAHR